MLNSPKATSQKVNCKPTLLPNHLDFIKFKHHVEGKEKNLVAKHGSGLQQQSHTKIKKGERPGLNTQTSSKQHKYRQEGIRGDRKTQQGWVEVVCVSSYY